MSARGVASRAFAFLLRELAPSAIFQRLFAFFAAPTDGSGAAVFRIAYGLLAASVAVWTAVNAERWFANTGVMVARGGALKNTLYRFGPDAAWMPGLHVALLALGALLLVIGLVPRLGALLVFVAHTSLQHRTPPILNSGDRLFAIVALLAVTLPLANRASVHSWWRARRGIAAPRASMWGQRLIQIQIAYVYGASALSKAHNARWIEGRALRDVLSSPVFAEWPTFLGFWPLVYAMTWGTLVFELGFPALVWFRKLRPWFLVAGVAFHLGIDVLMIIPMFSYIMIVSYAAFLDDGVAARMLAFARLAPRPADAREAPPTLRSASEPPPPEATPPRDEIASGSPAAPEHAIADAPDTLPGASAPGAAPTEISPGGDEPVSSAPPTTAVSGTPTEIDEGEAGARS